MTQASKQRAPSPKQAFRRRSRLDRAVDLGLLRAIGEPTRARLLSCLLQCGRPCSVSEIAECCDLDFSTVSRHLAHLARVGALRCKKSGRTREYAADAGALSETFRSLADAIEHTAPSECGGSGCACHHPTERNQR